MLGIKKVVLWKTVKSISVWFFWLGVPGGSVHGAVLDGLFQGVMVVSQDEIYFIEPASRYFRGHDPPTHAHSVIYREEDMNLDPYR